MKRLIQFIRYNRMRRELYMLGDKSLSDIGIPRYEIDKVCKRAVYGS